MRKLTRFRQEEVYSLPADTVGLYVVIKRLDKTVYIFDAAFIHLIRYALTTFCTSEMSEQQRELFLTYIDAFNGIAPFTDITSSLDEELVNLTLCLDDASEVVCGNSASFTYEACGIDINL